MVWPGLRLDPDSLNVYPPVNVPPVFRGESGRSRGSRRARCRLHERLHRSLNIIVAIVFTMLARNPDRGDASARGAHGLTGDDLITGLIYAIVRAEFSGGRARGHWQHPQAHDRARHDGSSLAHRRSTPASDVRVGGHGHRDPDNPGPYTLIRGHFIERYLRLPQCARLRTSCGTDEYRRGGGLGIVFVLVSGRSIACSVGEVEPQTRPLPSRTSPSHRLTSRSGCAGAITPAEKDGVDE